MSAARAQLARRKWRYLFLLPALALGLPFASRVLAGRAVYLPPDYPFDFLTGPGFGLLETGILATMTASVFVFPMLMIGLASTTAARSIQGELASGNWQTLVLSNLTHTQILVGKWWGMLRAFASDFVLAAVGPTLLAFVVSATSYFRVLDIDVNGLCQPLWGILRPYCARDMIVMFEVLQPGYPLRLLDNAALAMAVSVLFVLGIMAYLALTYGALRVSAAAARRAVVAQ